MTEKIDRKTIQKEHEKTAMRVSTVSIIVNVALSALKFFAGIFAHSGAMISDAVHSLSDVLSTFIVMIGVKISGKERDEKHPYGHDRFECLAAILLSAMLIATGVMIGWNGIQKIIHADTDPITVPGVLALIAAVVSIAAKEWMYWYTRNNAKKINSTALMADAWHHRSDAMSSIGSLVGIAGARMGYPILDPVASVLIAIMIVKVACTIGKDGVERMLDVSAGEDISKAIAEKVLEHSAVRGIDDIRTRKFGAGYYVDLEIALDGNMKLYDAHAEAEKIHDDLEAAFPLMKHCMIHVNPYGVGKHE